MTTNDVVDRLDRVIAILQLAHEDAISRARDEIMSDKVNKAILKFASKEMAAGKLVKTVASQTKQSTRTVQIRIGELIARGLLAKYGGGTATTYKSTGIV